MNVQVVSEAHLEPCACCGCAAVRRLEWGTPARVLRLCGRCTIGIGLKLLASMDPTREDVAEMKAFAERYHGRE